MASIVSTFRCATRTCRRCQFRPVERRRILSSLERHRQFTTSAARFEEKETAAEESPIDPEQAISEEEAEQLAKRIDDAFEKNQKIDIDNLDWETAKSLFNIEAGTPEEYSEKERDNVSKLMKSHWGQAMQRSQMRPAPDDAAALRSFQEPRWEKPKEGFWNQGEDKMDAIDHGEDPEFEGDDVTMIAHTELEQHRDFREYARLAAWEMPLLSKMAKPFEPPTEKQILRFRYTTYMGESHPAEKKVVVEFCVDDLPGLTQVQKDKVKKLVGARYNPETEIVKMSCEMFANQAQNKRYLADLVDNIVTEAKDPTDTFEDVPLDFRYHKFKVKPKFPVEWRLTEERRAQLEAARNIASIEDQKRAVSGEILDGVQEIKAALDRVPAREAVAVPITARADSKRKGSPRLLARR